LACASDAHTMPEIVHRYIRLAFSYGVGALEDIADPTVAEFNALARQVETEREHTRQFVRFSRMSDGSFMSVFQPNANVVPLTCNYFVKRMSTERFFIVDPAHHIVSFYAPEMKTFGTIQLDDASLEELLSRTDLATDEKYVQAMWRRFYEGVGLEGRGPAERGYDLRAHWMPKRVWQGLPELTASTNAEAARSQGVPARYQGRENRKDVHHIEQKQTFRKELTSGL
jgi:probable DNA metabolism protein